MWMAIANGPNELRIPCLVFESKESGERYLTKHLGAPNARLSWEFDPDMAEVSEEKINAVFTSYYNGCGAADSIDLEWVELETPFVPFNLD